MTLRFADSWFYLAFLDRGDARHQEVQNFLLVHETDDFLTTRWVLAEVANALGKTRLRNRAATLLNRLERDSTTVIAQPSDELYIRGLKLYSDRPDKGWSLTDCISFVVMQDEGVTEALTGDRHFMQAGFKALFA
jgi:uncharacterized protein